MMEKRKIEQDIRHVTIGNTVIEYVFIRKQVKHVNLRIRYDGTVMVSANKDVPITFVDEFVRKKSAFVISGREKVKIYQEMKCKKNREITEEEKAYLVEICKDVYPLFQMYTPEFPKIRIKEMRSMWGSCRPKRNIITLNSRLLLYPPKCAEFIVMHEFVHFIHPNHSKEFYETMDKMMPDWRIWKDCLKRTI